VNQLDRPIPGRPSAREWLMPGGRVTWGSLARAAAALWAGLILLATPPVLLRASHQLAVNAERDKSGVLMLAAIAVTSLVVALAVWAMWSYLSGRRRAADSPLDGGAE